jgi:hypothetical protein
MTLRLCALLLLNFWANCVRTNWITGGTKWLSRELIDISKAHDSHAVVVGTYAASKYVAYISVKMVSTVDNSILSSYDYSVPVGTDTRQLLMMKSSGKGR